MSLHRLGTHTLAAVAIAAGATLFAGAASADVKIGYIDSARILAEYKGVDDAKRSFDQQVDTWKKEEERLRLGLDSLAAEYKSQNLMLTEATRKEKEAVLKQRKTEYEEFVEMTFGVEGKVAQKNAELMKPIIDKVNVILETIASAENYTMIFDAGSGGIVYASPGADLTARVIEELNKGAQ